MKSEEAFLEWAFVHGYYYATSRVWLEEETARGHDVLLEIDVQGAEQVVAREPEALLIFIAAPSAEVQEQRLRGRGDTTDQIHKRVLHAATELAAGERLGAQVVVNDRLDATVDQVLALIRGARPASS
jgi:guanylate kinase